MKIIELRGENVKIIKAIRIRPKGNMVIISGKNEAGKTSVLDLIWYCIEGGAGLKGTPVPIRKGESKAKAITVLSEPTEEEELAIENGENVILKPLFTVTRTWTEKGSYLKVTDAQGEVQQSPQELLDTFKGRLTFDPLEFAQMKEKDQRELLLKLANIDLEELDNELVDVREKRRLQGQEVNLLTGEREEITMDDLPEFPIQYINIDQKLEQAIKNNSDIEKLTNSIEEKKEMIEDYTDRIEKMQRKIEYAEVEIKHHKKWLLEHGPVDVDAIRNKMIEAEQINDQIKARERNKAADEKADEAQVIYDTFTDKIEELEDIKKGILDKAKMPIVGFSRIVGKEKPVGKLSVSDTGVIFNGIPFSQLSQSETLKVSMGMAMALNPRLRVLRITDGSLLDEENMAVIEKMAKDNDFQIWIERVSGAGEVGFLIEDGEIKDEVGAALGHAPEVKVSEDFTEDTMKEITDEEEEK